MQNNKERVALEKAYDLLASYSQNDAICCSFHKTKICQIDDCLNEATMWIEDKTQLDNTFYLCDDHEDLMDENWLFRGEETAVYCCDMECSNCNP